MHVFFVNLCLCTTAPARPCSAFIGGSFFGCVGLLAAGGAGAGGGLLDSDHVCALSSCVGLCRACRRHAAPLGSLRAAQAQRRARRER